MEADMAKKPDVKRPGYKQGKDKPVKKGN